MTKKVVNALDLDMVMLCLFNSDYQHWCGTTIVQPPIAVQMIKQSINAVSAVLDDAVMHMDTDQNLLTVTTEDRSEEIKAFFEKRDPLYHSK